MKKIVIERPGGYRQLKIREFPTPNPAENEVVVQISAAGVNFADVVIRMGLYKSAKEFVGWPVTPGFEFAGKVMKCGAGVSDLVEGTAVFGVARFGAYASHVCVPRHQVFKIAEDSQFTSDEWAVFPTVFLTAYHGLYQNLILCPGMKILVHSAAGGVGGALLQLGKIASCQMIGVVGLSSKVNAAFQLGADFVIDKSKENLWKRAREICPEGFDIVLDGNGPSTLRQSYKHLAPAGKLVAYGFHSFFSKRKGLPNYVKLAYQYLRMPRWNPLQMTNDNKSVISYNLSYLFHRRDLLEEAMQHLLEWVENGQIKPPTLQRFPFYKVADAHRAIESGTTVGKLLLTFDRVRC
jgi:NADPH:quinone reductase-like Zn-dependent oxidoreductase